jgi:phage replication initiation protein
MDGLELKRLRQKMNLSLRAMSELVEINYSLLSRYENNQRFLTQEVEEQIKEKLGLSSADWLDFKLCVHLDYLRLTFFDTEIETVISLGLGLEMRYFRVEENQAKGYDEIFSCGSIKIYRGVEKQEQDGSIKAKRNDILLELSGQALKEYEEILLERGFTLLEWLRVLLNDDWGQSVGLYSRIQCSRIDLAIDEYYQLDNSNYDIHKLREKMKNNLIETSLDSTREIENRFKDKPQGLTLYFGSSNGHFLLRIYEKAKEQAKKQRKELETILEENGVLNRYEMQCREQYAEDILTRIYHQEPLEKIAINLFLSKFEVYEKVGEKERFDKKFYALFGDFSKVKINGKKQEKTFERTMNWLTLQVIPSLAMVREVKTKEWLFDWLESQMREVEFSKKQLDIINGEKALLSTGESEAFLYWDKELRKEKQNTR